MSASPSQVPLHDLVRAFGRVGLISFGGPAGHIALMHQVVVQERKWLDEDQYLRALNFCTLLPGPEAQQLATYVGWRLHGVAGGLVAGGLFVLPGAAVILALSILYAYAADLTWVQGAFFGVKAAVLAIILQALVRLARRALDTGLKRGLALATFGLLFLFNAPFPAVILGAALIGALFAAPAAEPTPDPESRPRKRDMLWRTGRAVAVWGAVWAAPALAILLMLGPDHVLMDIAAFFSKLAVVTFGGAYAVLAYMAQEAVQTHGWLDAGQMADGLGLAETTPGPLILVTQFVGFLAAFRFPEPFTPLMAGIIGAGLATWMTFAPCFLWIFALAPWIERLEHARRLQAALSGVTAAVVGVIANLGLWFALHVLFDQTRRIQTGPLDVTLPVLSGFQPLALVLAAVAAIALIRFKLGIMTVLAGAVAAGVALQAVA
ncbi:MAG: chromate efflux transporter [Brevundimonas sp.]